MDERPGTLHGANRGRLRPYAYAPQFTGAGCSGQGLSFSTLKQRMSVYRLDPINLSDPSWELSSVKEAVWAGAQLKADIAVDVTCDWDRPGAPPGDFTAKRLASLKIGRS